MEIQRVNQSRLSYQEQIDKVSQQRNEKDVAENRKEQYNAVKNIYGESTGSIINTIA